MKTKTAIRQLIEYCDYLIDDWGVQGDGVSYILDIKKKAKEVELSRRAAELYADSVARELQHDDLVMLKDLYNACCKYEKERQGLMSWEIPSLHRAKQILSRKYPDMTFDEDGRLIYRP